MTFAEMTGAHVYTVHTSCEESVREALVGKQRGVNVWIETLIQYLLLDRTDAEKPNFEGAKNVMSPPLRDKKNQPFLWDGLRDGSIATLATDHAPFDFDAQKRMGEGDFTRIPNGIPSLENRVDLYFTHGVKGGRISLQRFVDTASTAAAKIFGLFPRKGAIQVGSDADLVVYDPEYRGTISAKTHLMNLDYNSFEGWRSRDGRMSSPSAGKSRRVTVSSRASSGAGSFCSASRRISSG
jgi:dihydropyrimidinase